MTHFTVTQLSSDGPRDVEIAQDSAAVGDTLRCTSDANPVTEDAGYTWNISGTIYTGSQVKLTDEHEGLQDIECCAENSIREISYTQCTPGNNLTSRVSKYYWMCFHNTTWRDFFEAAIVFKIISNYCVSHQTSKSEMYLTNVPYILINNRSCIKNYRCVVNRRCQSLCKTQKGGCLYCWSKLLLSVCSSNKNVLGTTFSLFNVKRTFTLWFLPATTTISTTVTTSETPTSPITAMTLTTEAADGQ